MGLGFSITIHHCNTVDVSPILGIDKAPVRRGLCQCSSSAWWWIRLDLRYGDGVVQRSTRAAGLTQVHPFKMFMPVDTVCNYTCNTYMHTYIQTDIHIYIYIYTFIYIQVYIHTYMHAYIHTYYIHAYIHTYVHTYIRTYIQTFIYIHICIYTYIHIFTYVYTYLHVLYPAYLLASHGLQVVGISFIWSLSCGFPLLTPGGDPLTMETWSVDHVRVHTVS